MDVLHRVLKFISYNRWTVLGIVLAISVGIWIAGCDAKTRSLLTPEQKVTVEELEREVVTVQRNLDRRAIAIGQQTDLYNMDVESYNKAIELAEADLARQVELRRKLIEFTAGLGTAIAEGTVNPASLIGTLAQLLLAGGVFGLGLDNVRKGRVIKKQKVNGTV